MASCDPFAFEIEFDREPSLWESTDSGTTVQFEAGHYRGDWNLYWDEDDQTTVRLSATEREQPGVLRDIRIAETALARHASLTLTFREHRLTDVPLHNSPTSCPVLRRTCYVTPAGGNIPKRHHWWPDTAHGRVRRDRCAAEDVRFIPEDQPFYECTLAGNSDGGCGRARGIFRVRACSAPYPTRFSGEASVNSWKNHQFVFDLTGAADACTG